MRKQIQLAALAMALCFGAVTVTSTVVAAPFASMGQKVSTESFDLAKSKKKGKKKKASKAGKCGEYAYWHKKNKKCWDYRYNKAKA
jgi:hypothetical protein